MTAAARPRIVLVGGGHTHVGVLRWLQRRAGADTDIRLITPEPRLVYSGMLPGLVAGHYELAEASLDLAPLAKAAGVSMIDNTLVGLDADAGVVRLADGRAIEFDLLSLDTGSAGAPETIEIANGARLLSVKPVDELLAGLAVFEREAQCSDRTLHIAVAGGGAGGVEFCLALAHRYRRWKPRPGLELIAGHRGLLPDAPLGARSGLAEELARAGITVRSGAALAAVQPGAFTLDNDRTTPCDLVVLATGATPPRWPSDSGLAVDKSGFVAVDWTLRSRSHPQVFATGDLAALPVSCAKSGVAAVRQGPILAENLLRAAAGGPRRAYAPQPRSLSLISLGDRRAIAIRGPIALPASRLLWRLKNRIDRRFVDR